MMPRETLKLEIAQALQMCNKELNEELTDIDGVAEYLELAWNAEPDTPYTVFDWINETSELYPEYFQS